MKIHQRTLKVKLKYRNKDIKLTIYAANPETLKGPWDQLFTVIAGDLEFFADRHGQMPSHLELYLDDTYEATRTKPTPATAEKSLDELSNDLLTIIEPRYTMADIVLPEAAKDELEQVVFYCQHKAEIDGELLPPHLKAHEVGIYINFFGPSGTGKTMAAEIMAHRLNQQLMVVNYANLESELVGRTSKNIHAIFQIAAQRDCVLMFDEADSFLSARIDNLRQSADYGINTSRSQLLKELEAYQGVVIFATNNIKNYDLAFQRRLHFNVHFPLPEAEARHRILQKLCFSSQLAPDLDLEVIADKIEDFSGGDIQNLVKRTMIRGLMEIEAGRAPAVEEKHFRYGIDVVHAAKAAFESGIDQTPPLNIETLRLSQPQDRGWLINNNRGCE